MYEEGFASREDIDEGMRLGAGHPMGALTVADMVGLDIVHSAGNSMYEKFKATNTHRRRCLSGGTRTICTG
jgi:3-hydroxybutyryl-CoA dehydrogenase